MSLIRLLLPVLFPSWRFFSSIGPAPALQWCWVVPEAAPQWLAFRPKTQARSLWQSLAELLHNPWGNETLYLNACAEKLLENQDPERIHQIYLGLARALERGEIAGVPGASAIAFRVLRCCRDYPAAWQCEVALEAPALPLNQLKRLLSADAGLLP
jgi:hypothetical protein